MPITGTEWLILGAIIFLVIILRPRTVVDLSKSMGKVVHEFRTSEKQASPDKPETIFAETAERLGIRTEGKDADMIREEILAKVNRSQH